MICIQNSGCFFLFFFLFFSAIVLEKTWGMYSGIEDTDAILGMSGNTSQTSAPFERENLLNNKESAPIISNQPFDDKNRKTSNPSDSWENSSSHLDACCAPFDRIPACACGHFFLYSLGTIFCGLGSGITYLTASGQLPIALGACTAFFTFSSGALGCCAPIFYKTLDPKPLAYCAQSQNNMSENIELQTTAPQTAEN